MEEKIFPTWGYKSDGSAQIFNLKEEDEDLPDGWSRHVEPWNHPNTAHLHSRPAEAAADLSTSPELLSKDQEPQDETQPKKRGPGRPPKAEFLGL